MDLIITKKTDCKLISRMSTHYSNPRGFVGRSICYAVYFDNKYYGHIVAGSATRFLPGRNEHLKITINQLNNVINNIFFNVEPPIQGKYPKRNFTSAVVKRFVECACLDWQDKYGDRVIGFETLVELPRTGELYKRAGWSLVGKTKGFTCKRIAGIGTDKWTGQRVWNTNNLSPKYVFCYKLKE